ncbi:MAG: replicative DNA helicase [Candidatus Dadabacteria bacterium]|nr:MAG: replicative DNA helicase [Candidatus Dadabacteria bacterium]
MSAYKSTSKKSSNKAAAFGSRTPPYSSEAEESVLGGILIDNDAINIALERLRPEDFYSSANSAIFSGMVELSNRNEPIDVITLSEQLKSMGMLEQAGGLEYLGRLAASVPSAANVAYYARVVKEMSLRRRVIHEASNVISEAFEVEGSVDDFLDIAEQKILGISEQRVQNSFYKVADVVQDSIKLVEKLYDKKELVTGVPSGFDKLDAKTAGFQPSDLIIIAARPSMGKTALALSIVQYVAIYKKIPVALFSLEMSKEQLVLRMLCSEARVDNSKVRTGHLGERDFPRLVDAASKIAESPMFIDDSPAITVMELRAKARRLHREVNLGLIVVDYLQLMRSPAYSQSREQEISDISRSLKALAKELNVPVIALSQLNRSVESRNDKRPLMSDLRESGAIEQDADIIMFIYRDEVYHPENTENHGVAELIVSKQRTGPTGTVRVAFSPEFTRFDNLEEQHEDILIPEEEGDEIPDWNLDNF